jgi:hypothetical protein
MQERTVKWLIFSALTLGAPILLYMVMFMAITPLSGLPAIFIEDPDARTAIFLLVHLAFYGVVFYFLSLVLAKLIFLLPEFVRLVLVSAICLALLWLPFLPIFGGCYAGCDHETLFGLYETAIHAI